MRNKTRFLNKYRKFLVMIAVFCIGAIAVYAQIVNSSFTVEVSRPGAEVAPICRGQQIEEFNHQFSGGLYAQLVRNPSFEGVWPEGGIWAPNAKRENPIAEWFLIKNGSSDGVLKSRTSAETAMLNNSQEHCIKMEITSVSSGSVGLANGGYWGMKIEDNTTYKLSFWAKSGGKYKGTVTAHLESKDGKAYAISKEFKLANQWRQFTCELITKGVSKVTGENRLVLYASATGEVFFDVVTLMPPTWKNRPNGLRPDLAEKLAALKMKYIQFPGGCTAESANLDTSWNWKNSIGPLEERAGDTRHRFGYRNDQYFGLDDYFLLCEDMGAEPIYTTSAGISETDWDKVWFGVCPPDKMQPIIDDILDLIEYCNGPVTSKWGAKRAANDHPVPYNLKYIEIGNENSWTLDAYNERYAMIHKAVKSKYPYIKIMYNGVLHKNELSSTYGNEVDFTDEHFYLKDLSALYNKFDSIDPACKKICVAEFATSIKGNGGTIRGIFRDALGDAAFNLGCEKNSERMWWTGYGNYGGFFGQASFSPCIVWNDAVSCFGTPSYYAQKMLFSDNEGTRILPFRETNTNCFWSASIDEANNKKDVLIKVVNNKDSVVTVKINLNGVAGVNPEGRVTVIKGLPGDENSIAEPEKIFPSESTFKANTSFNYTFPPYSITVLRIQLI